MQFILFVSLTFLSFELVKDSRPYVELFLFNLCVLKVCTYIIFFLIYMGEAFYCFLFFFLKQSYFCFIVEAEQQSAC